MAYFRLAAQFFVSRNGAVIPKACALPRSHAFRIYKRDGGFCQNCGVQVMFGGNTTSPFDKIKAGAIDHILARSRGGQNTDDNLRLLCITCNARKGAK